MSFTVTWNSAFENAPADTADINGGATRIRELKEAIRSRMDVEHHFGTSDGDDQGIHSFSHGNTSGRVTGKEGRIYLNTEHNMLDFYDGSNWHAVGVPKDSKMLFYAASAPYGYTQDTTITDRVIRVVDGAGAATGGGWTISGLSIGNTTLSTSQMPAHTHTYLADTYANVRGDGGSGAAISTYANSTGVAGSSASHGHSISSSGAWRPAYADVIMCTKD